MLSGFTIPDLYKKQSDAATKKVKETASMTIPGNAFSNLLLNPDLPPEAYEQVIKLYGLDKPLSERVILYIG